MFNKGTTAGILTTLTALAGGTVMTVLKSIENKQNCETLSQSANDMLNTPQNFAFTVNIEGIPDIHASIENITLSSLLESSSVLFDFLNDPKATGDSCASYAAMLGTALTLSTVSLLSLATYIYYQQSKTNPTSQNYTAVSQDEVSQDQEEEHDLELANARPGPRN